MSEIIIADQATAFDIRPVSGADITRRREHVLEIIHNQMQDGVHFGVFPGSDNVDLLKPGVELLLSVFMIGLAPRVEDISPPGELAYRVTTDGVYLPTSKILGRGCAECSSREERFAWRKAINDDEFNYYPEDQRRVKFYRGYNGKADWHQQQVRVDPQSVGNTVNAMAQKRAAKNLLDNVLGTGDLFDEMTRAYKAAKEGNGRGGQRQQRPPRNTPTSTPTNTSGPPPAGELTEGMRRQIGSALQRANLTPDKLLAHFQIQTMTQLTADRINEVLQWIGSNTQP
jgi:hypothetical protein